MMHEEGADFRHKRAIHVEYLAARRRNLWILCAQDGISPCCTLEKPFFRTIFFFFLSNARVLHPPTFNRVILQILGKFRCVFKFYSN